MCTYVYTYRVLSVHTSSLKNVFGAELAMYTSHEISYVLPKSLAP